MQGLSIQTPTTDLSVSCQHMIPEDIEIQEFSQYFNLEQLRLIRKFLISMTDQSKNPSQNNKIKIFFLNWYETFLKSLIFDVISTITRVLIGDKNFVYSSISILADFLNFVMVSVLGASKHNALLMTYVVGDVNVTIRPIRNDKLRMIGLEPKFFLEVNSIIADQYTVLVKLGNGVYGDVYLIKNIFTHQLFAFKLFEQSTDYENELWNVSYLSNIPGVVHPISTIKINLFGVDCCGYLMQYFEEGTLEQYAIKHSLHEKTPEKRNELVRIFKELVYIIRECNNNGVYHCDIKPHNVLMTLDGHPYIADWGISSVSSDNTLDCCWYRDINHLIVSEPFRDPYTWLILRNQPLTPREGEHPLEYRASFLVDIWAILLSMIWILSNGRYLICKSFDVFKKGQYFDENSQELIDQAIDSVFDDDESNKIFKDFLKEWLNIGIFKEMNESVLQDSPDFLLSIYSAFFNELDKVSPSKPKHREEESM